MLGDKVQVTKQVCHLINQRKTNLFMVASLFILAGCFTKSGHTPNDKGVPKPNTVAGRGVGAEKLVPLAFSFTKSGSHAMGLTTLTGATHVSAYTLVVKCNQMSEAATVTSDSPATIDKTLTGCKTRINSLTLAGQDTSGNAATTEYHESSQDVWDPSVRRLSSGANTISLSMVHNSQTLAEQLLPGSTGALLSYTYSVTEVVMGTPSSVTASNHGGPGVVVINQAVDGQTVYQGADGLYNVTITGTAPARAQVDLYSAPAARSCNYRGQAYTDGTSINFAPLFRPNDTNCDGSSRPTGTCVDGSWVTNNSNQDYTAETCIPPTTTFNNPIIYYAGVIHHEKILSRIRYLAQQAPVGQSCDDIAVTETADYYDYNVPPTDGGQPQKTHFFGLNPWQSSGSLTTYDFCTTPPRNIAFMKSFQATSDGKFSDQASLSSAADGPLLSVYAVPHVDTLGDTPLMSVLAPYSHVTLTKATQSVTVSFQDVTSWDFSGDSLAGQTINASHRDHNFALFGNCSRNLPDNTRLNITLRDAGDHVLSSNGASCDSSGGNFYYLGNVALFSGLPDGSYTLSFTAADGTVLKTVPFTVDATPPSKPAALSASPTDEFGTTQTISFSSSSDNVTPAAGVQYTVTITDASNNSHTVNETGASSATVNFSPYGGAGTYSVTVTATDAAGNQSEASQITLVVAPLVALSQSLNGQTVDQGANGLYNVALTGTAPASAQVDLYSGTASKRSCFYRGDSYPDGTSINFDALYNPNDTNCGSSSKPTGTCVDGSWVTNNSNQDYTAETCIPSWAGSSNPVIYYNGNLLYPQMDWNTWQYILPFDLIRIRYTAQQAPDGQSCQDLGVTERASFDGTTLGSWTSQAGGTTYDTCTPAAQKASLIATFAAQGDATFSHPTSLAGLLDGQIRIYAALHADALGDTPLMSVLAPYSHVTLTKATLSLSPSIHEMTYWVTPSSHVDASSIHEYLDVFSECSFPAGTNITLWILDAGAVAKYEVGQQCQYGYVEWYNIQPFSALSDGSYTLSYKLDDGTVLNTWPFTVDTTPPSTPVDLSAAPANEFGTSQTISFSSSDNVTPATGVQYTVTITDAPYGWNSFTVNETGSSSTTIDFSSYGGYGTYTVTVTATDAAGNQSQPSQPITVVVAPQVALSQSLNGQTVYQ